LSFGVAGEHFENGALLPFQSEKGRFQISSAQCERGLSVDALIKVKI